MHECWRMILRIITILCLNFVTVASLRLYGEIGKRLELPCITADPLPGGAVVWVDQTKITPDDRRSFANRSLVINEYRAEDQDVYFCQVETESGLLYGDPVAVLTTERRIIRFSSPSISVKVGDSVRLSCPLTDWFPKPKNISWFKGDQNLPHSDDRFTFLPHGVLLISNVTFDDGGDYSCGVRQFGEYDGLFTSQNSVTLNITEGEREFNILKSPPKSLSVELGQTIYLECFINSVNGEYVEWRKLVNGKWAALTASDDRVNVKENQFMSRMTLSHDDPSQAYQCIVMADNFTIAQFDSLVVIHSPPYSSSDSGRLIVKQVDQNFRAKFDCAVDGIPSPERRWYKNGKDFKVCHNIQIHADGSLQIDFASESDSGFYQCVAKNNYGMLILSYRLDVKLAVDPLLKPLITSMQLTPRSSVEIKSQLCQPTSSSTEALALQFDFVENRCEPTILTVQKIEPIANVDCTHCLSDSDVLNCICCVYTLELPAVREVTEFIITISRIDAAGFTMSDSKIIAVQPVSVLLPDPSPLIPTISSPSLPESLELEIRNFGTAILVQWNMITNATGYVVLISRHVGDTQATESIGRRDLNKDQNFTFIEGTGDRMTIGVIANSRTAPVFAQIQNISASAEVPGYPAPIVAATYPQEDAVLLFWQWDQELKVDKFEIVYICDIGRGILTVESSSSTFATIPGVDTYCDIMVGPIISGKPSTAAVTRFDRWCQTISPPEQVKVTPKGSYSTSALVVKWEANNVGCEMNYRVKWKPASQQQFADSDYVEVSNKLITDLSLMSDIAYDIQVLAYTDNLAAAVAGDVISYVAGVPDSPENIEIETDSTSGLAIVEWSHPNGPHEITLYLIRLHKKSKNGHWDDVQTLPVSFNSTEVELKNLQVAVTYNVTVNSINLFGSSEPTSKLFKLYPVQDKNDDVDSDRRSLNETELGIIIGVAVGVVCLVTTIAVCIMFSRRFKNQRGSRAQQLTQRDSEVPGNLYLDNGNDEQEMQERQPLQEISEDSSTVRDFGSPFQLSHKATSAQDSGIATDDLRSSQDLGEYESHELLESPVSLDEMFVGTPARWSCEMSSAIPDNCHQNGHNNSIPRTKQKIEDNICTPRHKQVPASIDSLVINV